MAAYQLRGRDKFNDPNFIALRGLTQDIAGIKLVSGSGWVDFTDSSTGTAGSTYPALNLSAAPYDGNAVGATPVLKTDYDAAATASLNGMAVVAQKLNLMFTILGLPLITYTGTVAVAGTIPAQTKTFTAGTPTTDAASMIGYATGKASMQGLKNNMATLIRASNMLNEAVGVPPTADGTGGRPSNSRTSSGPPYVATAGNNPTAALTIDALPATTAGLGTPAGSLTISKAVMDAFFTGLANDLATIASKLNTLMPTLATRPINVVAVD